jgi:hypothetical protein
MRCPGGALRPRARRDGVLDLARHGEAPGSLLGEDEIAVDADVEDTARALDQLGPDAELALQLVRQTGGAREIISNQAVLDGDPFGHFQTP